LDPFWSGTLIGKRSGVSTRVMTSGMVKAQSDATMDNPQPSPKSRGPSVVHGVDTPPGDRDILEPLLRDPERLGPKLN
jgi:hypothetical protein